LEVNWQPWKYRVNKRKWAQEKTEINRGNKSGRCSGGGTVSVAKVIMAWPTDDIVNCNRIVSKTFIYLVDSRKKPNLLVNRGFCISLK